MNGPSEPDFETVTAAFLAAGARFVVIGGFAVIAHRFLRATEDVGLLVPDSRENDARCLEALLELGARMTVGGYPPTVAEVARDPVRVWTRGGLVDPVREGVAPLDFATVAAGALTADLGHGAVPIAGLRSLVALKRLAGRPRDLLDLAALEEEHGELPA